MIDALNQFVLQYQHPSYGHSHSVSIRLPRVWAVLFSLANQESKTDPAGSIEQDIRRSQHGDSDAYRRLIERHQSHVSNLLWRFTHDRTSHEELMQETFVQAYFSLPTYKSHAPFEHWLTRIATRAGYRFWRQRDKHRQQRPLTDEWEGRISDQTQQIDPQQASKLIHRLLSLLPPRDRLVLTMRYLEQCDVTQTARRTGWSSTMVRVQTYRAKQKLKKLLEKADISPEDGLLL